MKKLTIVTILFCITFTLQAQQIYSKGSVGITYSGLGSNDAFHWQALDGAGSYTGKGFYSLGITYIRPISSRIDLETGIEYSHFKYRANSYPGPGAPEPYNFTDGLVSIPITIRLNFLNYFFFNSGILLNVSASTDKGNTMDSQSGIGAMIGIGVKYDLKNAPIGFFVNPFYKHHAILPFSMEKHHLRTDNAGFRFGVVYRL